MAEVDPLVLRMEADLTAYDAALKRGGATLDQFASEATRKADTAARALGTVDKAAGTTAQTIVRLRDGMAQLPSGSGTADSLARGFERATKAAQDYERAAGQASQSGRNDNAPGASRGLNSYQKRDLLYQGGDVVASLGSGASLGTVGFQQGPQILQGLASGEGGVKGGLAALGQSAMALVTPVTVATTAVAGLGIAFTAAALASRSDQQVLQTATQGIGRVTGATASQLDALARSNAEAGKVSTSSAREMVAAYNSTGQIGTEVFASLIQSTGRYAQLTGQDAASATAELARAFSDIGNGADAIASKIGGLDDRTRQLIQTQIEQGDRSGAQQTLAEALKGAIDANAAATAGWAGTMASLSAQADKAWESVKRVAGLKLGVITESGAEAVTRLQTEVNNINERRKAFGQEPLNPKDSSVANQLEVAKVIADQERMIAAGKAAEERATQASTTAGNITRQVDPNFSRLSQLREQQNALRDGLADPLARSKLADQAQTEAAYTATSRAIQSMTDATGKMISAEEMSRRQDQLKIDSLNAKTDAQKKEVAERQKAFDLIGKTITPRDASGQVERAGTMSKLSSAAKSGGGGTSESLDDFDRAVKRTEDQTRRTEEQIATYGMGAAAVAQYRTEQELLVAAKRADKEITPALSAQIEEYGNKSADAAGKLERVRQAAQQSFQLQNFTGGAIIDVLDRIGERGTTAASIVADLAKSFQRAALQAAILGQGPLAGLFGTGAAPGSGAAGGLIGSLFGNSSGSPAAGAQGPSLPSVGFLATVGKAFGFAGGGYTGPGGRNDVAGLVHAGEYVFSQEDVRRLGGPDVMERLRQLPGYAGGGMVGSVSSPMPTAMPRIPSAVAASSGRSVPSIRMGDTIIDARGADSGVEQRLAALVAAQAAESRRTIGQQLANWKEDN